MPETAAKLGRMLGVEFARWPDFAEIEKLLRSVKISEPQALFVKLEELKAEGV
jgi:methionyl-tRNA synthetase